MEDDSPTPGCECAACRTARGAAPPTTEETVVGLTTAILLRDWRLVARIASTLRAGYLPDHTEDEIVELAQIEAARMKAAWATLEAHAEATAAPPEKVTEAEPVIAYIVQPADPILA